MIVYFSSTGNCKFIAGGLAEALGDTAKSITDIGEIKLAKGEKLGFVFPTYFFGLPLIVTDYLKKISVTAEDDTPYVFFVATFGTTCGQTGLYMKRLLKQKGIRLSASFSIQTVDDWTVWFHVSDQAKVHETLAKEGKQLQAVTENIRQCMIGNHMVKKAPRIAARGARYFYDLARRTKHLQVEDTCVACGLCMRECPCSAIELKNGKPVWVKKQCTMCLHCLHSCPKAAIHYDNKTQKNGQYQHP